MNIHEARYIARNWFADEKVQKALLEHLGITSLASLQALQFNTDPQRRIDYTTISNPTIYSHKYPVPARSIFLPELPKSIETDPLTEIGMSLRSMPDNVRNTPQEATLFWDIEAYDKNAPWQQLFDQLGFFQNMEIVYLEMEKILKQYQIPFLSVMTGRGYHFLSSINKNHPSFTKMLTLGKNIEPEILYHHQTAQFSSKQQGPLHPDFERLHRASSFLQQFVFLKLMANLKSYTEIPKLDISDTGTAGIALDNTVMLRHAGTGKYSGPGSPYIKPFLQPYKFGGEEVVNHTPLIFRIPKANPNKTKQLTELIIERQSANAASHNLSEMGTKIPYCETTGINQLINGYLESDFYQLQLELEKYEDIDPPETWPQTYQNYDAIKAKYSHLTEIIDNLNPRLLQPDSLRQVITTFSDDGWPPIHIAGFLNAAYTHPHIDWGKLFERHNPRIRHAIGWVYLVLSERLNH